MRTILCSSLVGLLLLVSIHTAAAHDTWLQTNTPAIHPGDAVYIDFYLGNHGNDHRDYKIAGKPAIADSQLGVIDPQGHASDLKPAFADLGYAPKEGFWQARFEPTEPGLYLAWQRSSAVASYAPERIVRSAKTFFLVSRSLDRVPAATPGFDRVLGDPLELVPQTSTIAPMGPGTPIKVLLLYRGKPLPATRVSFIPRGQTLTTGFDPAFDRLTDAQGRAEFEPKEAGQYLIVAHQEEPHEAGEGYTATKYSATLTVIVPALCPCCGD